MRISDWSSDVCSSDLDGFAALFRDDLSKPVLHLPRHPLKLAFFGMRTLLPATTLARRLGSPEASALFAGVAAHAFTQLRSEERRGGKECGSTCRSRGVHDP